MLEVCNICLKVSHSETKKGYGVVIVNFCKDCLYKKKIQ